MKPFGATDSRPERRSTRLLVAVIVVVTACASPAASPAAHSPSPTAAPVVSPALPATPPAATAAATRPPGLFHLVGSAPVIRRTIVPDRGAVLPGAIAIDGGRYHAWVVAFGNSRSAHDLLHLTSPDAIAWKIVEDPSLEALSAGLADPGAIPTSVLRGDGEWVMYFRGAPTGDRQAGEVWRATAPRLDGPWSTDGRAVVTPGPAGGWDSGGLDFPSVVRTGSSYTMLYSGVDLAHPEAGSLGLATSTDGLAWFKHGDPIIEPGLCGAHDARAIQEPRLVVEPDRLVVAYAGYAGALDTLANAGIADSVDGGLTWTCRWPSPAVDLAGLPDGLGLHTLLAFQRGERLALLFEWFERNGTDIWLADAPLVTD